jgi:hypothetical protein
MKATVSYCCWAASVSPFSVEIAQRGYEARLRQADQRL